MKLKLMTLSSFYNSFPNIKYDTSNGLDKIYSTTEKQRDLG